MTSRYDMHVYGESAPRSNSDWSKANPHGYKLRPIPSEKMCAFCDSQKDYIYALTGVVVCMKCANEVLERHDVDVQIKPYYGALTKPMFCARCGIDVIRGVSLNVKICSSCIEKAGIYEMKWQGRKIRKISGARKIA
ncbi:MAG: hypothetical protein QXL94_01680 [Candidatus Parvarchaeum sp.]